MGQLRGPSQGYRNLEAELQAAKAIVGALVRKYGPFHLSKLEIMAGYDRHVTVAEGPDGFTYATPSEGDPR